MWLHAPPTDHHGTPPAAALPTPFNFPCGSNFTDRQHDKAERERCAPPGFDRYWSSSVGYYSPAICPRGYTAGCFRWHADQGPAVEATETAVQCVPVGYECVTEDISNAFSQSHSAPMIQIRWAQTDLPGLLTHPLYPGLDPTDNGLMGESPTPTAHNNDLAARQVSSGFGADISSTRDGDPTWSGLSSIASGTGTGRPDGNGGDDDRPNFPSFTPSTRPGASTGLSTGAKIGIGVAVPVVFLLVAGMIGFFVWRNRKRKATSAAQQQHPPVDPSTYPWAQPQMTSQGGRIEMPESESGAVTMPAAAVMSSEKQELSSEMSYRGAPSFPAELHSPEHSQQRFSDGQNGRLEGDPHQLSSATTHAYSPPTEMDSSQQPVQVPPPTYHTHSPGLQQSTAPPLSSTPPAATDHTQAAQPSVEDLMQQQSRLEERRQRLLELEQIEREQAELEKRIKAQGRP